MKTRLVTTDPRYRRGAMLSDCGRYRYILERAWDDAAPRCVFIMLNPSVADANVDDPTIRRCLGFALRAGCGALRVVNLFAFRATSPDAMKKAHDPIGPENDAMLRGVMRRAIADGGPIVAAWGALGAHLDRDKAVADMAAQHGLTLVCLGKNGNGSPRHPLYVAADQPFEAWPGDVPAIEPTSGALGVAKVSDDE